MNAHILIIEQDPAVAGLFEDLLADQGYRTTTRLLGQVELDDINDLQPDLILADAPPLTAEDRLERMERFWHFRQSNQTPIVVTTTSSLAIQEIMHALVDQQICVLFKPFDVEDLYATLRNFLGPNTNK